MACKLGFDGEVDGTEPAAKTYGVTLLCTNCMEGSAVDVPFGQPVEAKKRRCPHCGCVGFLTIIVPPSRAMPRQD